MKVKIYEDGVFYERLEYNPKSLWNLEEDELMVQSRNEETLGDKSLQVDYMDANELKKEEE